MRRAVAAPVFVQQLFALVLVDVEKALLKREKLKLRLASRYNAGRNVHEVDM
jgi:hypothetical protein